MDEVQPTDLNEPATWIATPDAEGIPFELLANALRYAAAVPRADRHPLSVITTKSGEIYGWEAIDTLYEQIEILDAKA